MQNLQKKIWLGLILWLLSPLALAASDPVTQLQNIANSLISKLKAEKATIQNNRAQVYKIAYQTVVPYAAVDEMAKRVLPPTIWNNANSAQRARFQKQFTSMLVHTYASALADYSDQTVKFFPVRGGYQGKSTVQVQSKIERSDGPSISVSYRMVMRGSSWKLFDMSVEGVSMLESFRSQFSDVLSRGDINSLLDAMQKHNG